MKWLLRSLALLPWLAGAMLAAPRPAAALGLVSERQELDAGKQADADICKQYKVSTDRDQNGLVKHLGARLVKVCDRPNLTWTFRVLESKEVNAFSVPGYVYVNTALLKTVGKDQDALAGVIAHEIGHTCGRHAAKQMEKAAVGNILGSIIAGRSRTTGALVNITQNLVMLGYSRDDEFDADKRAVRYTIDAGYDPNGMVRFFQKLEKMEGSSSKGLATYFRTHPATSDRIKRVKNMIAEEGGPGSDR